MAISDYTMKGLAGHIAVDVIKLNVAVVMYVVN